MLFVNSFPFHLSFSFPQLINFVTAGRLPELIFAGNKFAFSCMYGHSSFHIVLSCFSCIFQVFFGQTFEGYLQQHNQHQAKAFPHYLYKYQVPVKVFHFHLHTPLDWCFLDNYLTLFMLGSFGTIQAGVPPSISTLFFVQLPPNLAG